VEITRDLFLHGALKKHVIFQRKNGETVQLPVDWDIEELVKSEKELKKKSVPVNTTAITNTTNSQAF